MAVGDGVRRTPPPPPPPPPPPAPPAPSKARRRGLRGRAGLILAGSVALVLLVGTAAFAGPTVIEAIVGKPYVALSGSAPVMSAWRGGYDELWTAKPLTIASQDPSVGSSVSAFFDVGSYAGRTDSQIMFNLDTSAEEGVAVSVNPSTGRRNWVTNTRMECSGIFDNRLRCFGGTSSVYPTELLDTGTGKVALTIDTPQQVGADVPANREYEQGWRTAVVDDALLAVWGNSDVTYEGTKTMSFTLGRINPDGRSMAWKTEFTAIDHWVTLVGRTVHGVVALPSVAVNVEDGTKLVDGDLESTTELLGAPLHPIEWVAQDTLQGGTKPSGPLKAPDGTALAWVESGALPVSTTELPTHPIRVSDGKATVFDPTNDDKTGWSVDVDPDRTMRHIAVHGDRIALVEQDDGGYLGARVTLINADDGTVLWTREMEPMATNHEQTLTGLFTADGTLLLQAAVPSGSSFPNYGERGEVRALDPNTGAPMWVREGILADFRLNAPGSPPMAPDTEKYDSIVINNLDGNFSLNKPAAVPKAPEGAPACPDDMSAVSWAKYDSGSAVVCKDDGGYRVVLDDKDRTGWKPEMLAFTPGGFDVTFADEQKLSVQAGGGVVTFVEGGKSTTRTADGWSATYGSVSLPAMDGLTACSGDTHVLLATVFAEGWIQVCGAKGEPRTMQFGKSGAVQNGTDVQAVVTGYCATFDSGLVCVNSGNGAVMTKTHGAADPLPSKAGYIEGAGSVSD